MRFPLQLSLAVVAVSCSIGGLFLLGQQGQISKEQATPQATPQPEVPPQPTSRLPDLTPQQGLLLAERLLPPKSWGKLSLLGSFTGNAPFADEDFRLLSKPQAEACRQEPAPRYLALAARNGIAGEAFHLDTLLSSIIAVSPTASQRFFECAAAKMKAVGGVSSSSAEGLMVSGPAGTLFQHENGALAFARKKEDLPALIRRLTNLPQLVEQLKDTSHGDANLSLMLFVRPQASWLSAAGPLALSSPLKELRSMRLRLIGTDELQVQFKTSASGAPSFHALLEKSANDLKKAAQARTTGEASLLTDMLNPLPQELRQQMSTLFRFSTLKPPQLGVDGTESVITLIFDLKMAGLSQLLQNPFGSAPQP